MILTSLPVDHAIDPRNSLLFLGSGFSTGAINIEGEKLPAGHPLLQKLAKVIGEDSSLYTLQTIVDEYRSRSDQNLYQILYDTFRVSKPLPVQQAILKHDWARIYTTNYDDLINCCKDEIGYDYPFFSYDDAKPNRLPSRFAVHLHGTIRKATEENVLDQLVLDETSYVSQIARRPAWMDEFARDQRYTNAIYILGYSLRDHHITSLFLEDESLRGKTYFITVPDPDRMLRKRASTYGDIVASGFDAFAEALKVAIPDGPPQIDTNSLASFKHLSPVLDRKAIRPLTSLEILDLVKKGAFNISRYFNSVPGSYIAERKVSVSLAVSLLGTCRTLIVHSRLGNGKTIFNSLIARYVASPQQKVFRWRKKSINLDQQLDVLARSGRVIIQFDDYDVAYEMVPRIADRVPEARFIVSIRTSHQEVRFHEILQRFPQPVERLNLNHLEIEDRESFYAVLDKAGAHVDNLEQTLKSANEIRDFVTTLYNNEHVRRQLEHEIGTLLAIRELRDIVIVCHILNWSGTDIEPTFLRSITGRDAYAELKRNEFAAGDFLKIIEGEIEVRSSLLSVYLVERIFDPHLLLDAIFDIIIAAIRRREERKYRKLMGELVKFSTLKRALRFKAQASSDLQTLYERLSRDVDLNKEPLFWLQYAILMIDLHLLEEANNFLTTGYNRAEKIEGFETYQLDTQSLRLQCMREQISKSPTMEFFAEIIDKLGKVNSMIIDVSHRTYAISVLDILPSMISVRYLAMNDEEKSALRTELLRSIQDLTSLSISIKMESGSDSIKHRLETSLKFLQTTNL